MTFQAMSDNFGLTLGQIKNFMSDRLKRVPPEIEDVLVHKLNLNPMWLIEGTGQMYKKDDTFLNVRHATNAAIEVVMHYAPLSHGLIMDMQQAAFNDSLDKDMLIERFRDRLPQSAKVEDEVTLLDNYRIADDEDKQSIKRMAELAAESAKNRNRGQS